ncbi:MAG: cobalamin biosynthesis protein CobD [Nitrospirae bacterium]|nr:MAG: cobalamin biosynthesis protein CobD [Nitrospirota bacterium]
MFIIHLPEVILAILFDLIIGDPDSRFHPVRLMGLGIERSKRTALRISKARASIQVLMGGLTLILLCTVSYMTIYLLCKAISSVFGEGTVYWILTGFISSFSFAMKGLFKQTRAVLKALPETNEAKARLSMIVGRDTERLTLPGILRATIETLSENLSDSIVAPIFYLIIGGPPLGFLYRMVNTLDAMVGYRDIENRYFGLIPARADDLLNLIPSRLTALLLILAGVLMKPFSSEITPLKAIKITCRDAHKHPSPNAGYPEAAMAGLLGIKLLGPMHYHGKMVEKPFLNPEGRQASPPDYFLAERLSIMAIIVYLAVLSSLWYLSQ